MSFICLFYSGDAQSPGPLMSAFYDDKGQPMTIWVATSSHMIPPGSIIINKQTCMYPDGADQQKAPFFVSRYIILLI